ncbi:MAG: hypothetical protein Q4P36_01615 [Bowdeniella nasicola]|nr:hypothetical protein [Bowdeniella nasicola]
MSASPLTIRTVVVRIADPTLRTAVRELAELAGAHVPAHPWDVDPADPNCLTVFGDPPAAGALAEVGAFAHERALVVSAERADGPPPPGGLRRFVLPADAEALLERFGRSAQHAAVVNLAGLHGGAGTTWLAATLARYASEQSLRVTLIEAGPHPELGELVADSPAEDVWERIGEAEDLVPLRLVRALPAWGSVRLITGRPSSLEVVERTVAAARQACDVVVVEGLPVDHALTADVSLAIGVAGWRTARAWLNLPAIDGRQLIVRTPGDLPVVETLELCGAPAAHTWRSERGVARDRRHGGLPGDRRSTGTWRLVRSLWNEWTLW